MGIIKGLVDTIEEFLEEDRQVVFGKLEREIFNKGITVAEAWYATAPITPQEVTNFYKTTDAFIYDLLIDHHGKFRREVRETILNRLVKHNVRRVLDYGGGIGLDSIAMHKAGMDVTYFDLDGRTSQFAKWLFAREGCKIKIVNTSESILHNEYDGVVCIEVLEHVPAPLEVIENIHKYLKPNGIVLITDSFYDTGIQYPSHLESNKKYCGKIGAMMENCGFALTMRPPNEKPLEFSKMNRNMRFRYLQWKRRLVVGKDLMLRAYAYASKLR